ncbi:MAG: GNAT family protein [Bifidobacterium crudilactis]|uniref:GNAT family N-acetyltransferase n=1 Tax=Bifidobacterium crudilactis TaxID=327277 RepID=UPI002353BFC5|nr:GNAT family protein [Bifidobacterium crudilactis]MCI1218098.1 GNAT family N-acetyltransferase [Bifidobacterium crudilactis]
MKRDDVNLLPYNPTFEEALGSYQLSDLSFTGTPEHAIRVSRISDGYHPVLLVTGRGEIPTFLVLDYGDDKYRYTIRSDSMLIRSFSTDDRFHRRGFAHLALTLLPDYVHAAYENIHELVLGVNAANHPAQKLYEGSGFVKLPETYQGPKGEQLIYHQVI